MYSTVSSFRVSYMGDCFMVHIQRLSEDMQKRYPGKRYMVSRDKDMLVHNLIWGYQVHPHWKGGLMLSLCEDEGKCGSTMMIHSVNFKKV